MINKTKATVHSVAFLFVCDLFRMGWRFFCGGYFYSRFSKFRKDKIKFAGKKLEASFSYRLILPLPLFYCGNPGNQSHHLFRKRHIFSLYSGGSLVASTFILNKKSTKSQVIGIAITFIDVVTTILAAGTDSGLSFVGYLFLPLAVIL